MIRFLTRAFATVGALLMLTLSASATEPAASGTAAGKGAGQLSVATFGGGCFWCTQADFDKVPGVVKTVAGFMGGHTKNPTYDEVSWGNTGHVEVVEVTYDPAAVSYDKLVDYYFRHVDVLDNGGQFADRGASYRPVIFTYTDEQKRIAESAKTALDASKQFDRPVAVAIEKASDFTAADEHHQKYAEKNPVRYKFYRSGSGRDSRLKQLWGEKVAAH